LAFDYCPPDRRGVWLSIAGSALLASVAGCRPAAPGADGPAGSQTLAIIQTEAPRSMDPANHTATLTGTILDPMY
jgi:glutathione transport system substrate-binding protein